MGFKLYKFLHSFWLTTVTLALGVAMSSSALNGIARVVFIILGVLLFFAGFFPLTGMFSPILNGVYLFLVAVFSFPAIPEFIITAVALILHISRWCVLFRFIRSDPERAKIYDWAIQNNETPIF